MLGRITFLGRDVTRSAGDGPHADGCRAHPSRFPQPFEKLTVFENLLVAATYGQGKREASGGRSRADSRGVRELLGQGQHCGGRLGLLDRKRLELARAMATAPRLLLLDEIAGGLTEGECRILVDTIRDIHARGVTIIWIEHVLHALTRWWNGFWCSTSGKSIGIGHPETSWHRRMCARSIWGSRSEPAEHPWPDRLLRSVPGAVRCGSRARRRRDA